MAEPTHIPKIVEKPWGREIWYADQAAYAGKVLEVKQGRRLSLQYHERKTETLYLLSGKVLLTFRAIASGETPAVSLVTPRTTITTPTDLLRCSTTSMPVFGCSFEERKRSMKPAFTK